MNVATTESVQIEEIDAHRAAELLDEAAANRRLSDERVSAYSRDMQEGRWQPLASMIVIDEHGNLIDGQHRLAAIIQSNTKQQFIVRYDAPPASIDVIDSGRGRSAADTLRIEGHKYTSLISHAARLCLRYPWATRKRHALTNAEVVQFVRQNPEIAKLVHEHAPMHAHGHGWPSIGMLAALMFVTPQSKRGDVEAFWRQVYWLDNPGQPAKNLVRWLQNRSKQAAKGQRTEPWIMWQALVRSINAYYDDDQDTEYLRVSKQTKERLRHERRMFKDRSW